MSAGVQSIPLPSSNTAAAASGYFVDQKKGEVNELKQVSLSSFKNSTAFTVL